VPTVGNKTRELSGKIEKNYCEIKFKSIGIARLLTESTLVGGFKIYNVE
jgi:hypothetical protein